MQWPLNTDSPDLPEDAPSTWAVESVPETPKEGRVMDHHVLGEKISGTKKKKRRQKPGRKACGPPSAVLVWKVRGELVLPLVLLSSPTQQVNHK